MYYNCFSQSSIQSKVDSIFLTGHSLEWSVKFARIHLTLLQKDIHTLFDLIREINRTKCARIGGKNETKQKKGIWRNRQSQNSFAHPQFFFCEVSNLQLLTSQFRNLPHSLAAAQGEMLCQSHDGLSCLAEKHVLPKDFITQPNRIIPLFKNPQI